MLIADHFKELWSPKFGPPRGSVSEFLGPCGYADQDDIASYLRAGHEILSVMGSSQDALEPEGQILGGDSIYTDGDWLWRGDLWHYVRAHHIQLPEAFLARIRERGYSMPNVEHSRLLEVLEYVEARW